MDGKVVLITGASSGLGRAAAQAFAAEGADVALLARGRDGLEETAELVRNHGRRALVLPADVTDRAAVQRAIEEAVRELGALDVLVWCAAATAHGTFKDVSAEDFDQVVAVTFTGMVNTVRCALPHLEQTDGVVVATGSLVAKVPLPTFSSYAASKHGQRGLLNTLRAELRAQGSGVRIAQLHPGLINTPLWDQTANELPRRPPEGYDPAAVAGALVDLARHPRPEQTFGAEAQALDLLWHTARPVGDAAMRLIHHYFRSGARGEGTDILEQPVDSRETRGTLPVSRPSFTRPVTRLLGRLRP